jgi:type VI secretion system protein ImpF
MSKIVELELKRRLNPPLMHIFRTRAAARRKRHIVADATTTTRPQRAPIAENELRAIVEAEVETLMNHVSLDSTDDLSELPHVAASILNYGFPDISNRVKTELDDGVLKNEIQHALRKYEPRFIENSLRVSRDPDDARKNMQMRFIVDSELACYPLDVQMEFYADLDARDGKVTIARP